MCPVLSQVRVLVPFYRRVPLRVGVNTPEDQKPHHQHPEDVISHL